MTTPSQTPLPPPPRRRPVFYLCGDSLTQDGGMSAMGGWATLLQDAYLRSVDVINRGLCGYNTNMFRQYAMPVVREELRSCFAPVFFTLWLGANDAALVDGTEPELHVPVATYRQNLIAILQELQQLAPQATILLITPPVVNDDHRRQFFPSDNGRIDRTNQQASEYAAVCRDVVASMNSGVALLDLHTFLMETYPDPQKRATLLSDGLHFTQDGNRVVYEQLKAKIETLLPADDIERWQLPDYQTLV